MMYKIHEMRSLIMMSPSFGGDRILDWLAAVKPPRVKAAADEE
jgi:hypothetical protein